MKTLIKTTVLTTACVISFASLNVLAKSNFDDATERKLVRVCKAIQSGSQLKLSNAIKLARTNYKAVAQDLRCNGMDAITFAYHSGAQGNAKYIAYRGHVDDAQLVAKVDNN